MNFGWISRVHPRRGGDEHSGRDEHAPERAHRHDGGSFAALGAAPKYCWFGGVLALAITVTVMLGMGRLGPTLAVATILIAQLSAAAAIDAFGIMGTEKLAFGWSKWAGLALMTGGVLLFKMK